MRAIINEIATLYKTHGSSDYIGEKITQIEHAVQCAIFAEKDGADMEMIVAALLHDIGHLLAMNAPDQQMDNLGVKDHELVGRDYLLKCGFSIKAATLVANHVRAKRYLVTKFPDYRAKLSEASQQTLLHQNGIMTQEEMLQFESELLFEASLKIRGYDDQAKIVDYEIPEEYISIILKKYFKIEN